MDPVRLAPAALAFATERHLATLTTLRRDGTPHVVAVGWTWDAESGLARVITSDGTQKVRNAAAGGPAALCQVDGRRWLTVEGPVVVLTDPASVADAERRYAQRYRTPRANPQRVVLALRITRVLGSSSLLGDGVSTRPSA